MALHVCGEPCRRLCLKIGRSGKGGKRSAPSLAGLPPGEGRRGARQLENPADKGVERPAAAGEDTAPQSAPHFLVDGGTSGSRNGRTQGGPGRAGAFGLSETPGWCDPRAECAEISADLQLDGYGSVALSRIFDPSKISAEGRGRPFAAVGAARSQSRLPAKTGEPTQRLFMGNRLGSPTKIPAVYASYNKSHRPT